MRILLATDSARLHNGGLNRAVIETSVLLGRAGHDVALIYEDSGPSEVTCPAFPLAQGGSTAAVAAVLDRFQPELVQVHNCLRPPVIGEYAARVPTCVFLHDQTWFCGPGDRMKRNYSPCHRAHGPACLAWNYLQGCGGRSPRGNLLRWRRTESLIRGIRDLPSVRLQVASQFMADGLRENGFDPARIDLVQLFAERPAVTAPVEPGLLLLPSRLVRAKGVDAALTALAGLRHLPWRLVIAGDGGLRAALTAQTAAAGLAERVEFLGEITPTALARWYERAQIVLFPVLRHEPFGLVGVEALAHGRPIVAFAGGGVEEWLQDGETGLRVLERTPAAFGAALGSLLADPDRCRRMGEAARVRHARFTSEAYLQRLFTSFERVIAGFRPAASPA